MNSEKLWIKAMEKLNEDRSMFTIEYMRDVFSSILES